MFTPTAYDPYDFANRRHIGPSPAEMTEMLDACGVESLDQLIEETIAEYDAARAAPAGNGKPAAQPNGDAG